MGNILITGGTGFIGSRLALRLVSEGHQVKVYGQENTPAESQNTAEIKSKGIDLILGSMLDKSRITQTVKGIDTVYHLAAVQHEANVPDKVFWDVNLKGTKLLIQVCIKEGIQRFVHGSTIGVYGSALEGVITEKSPCRPDNIYGETKLAAEKMLSKYSDGLEIVIIRISETYGPGDRRLLKLFKGVRKKRFPLIGKGDNIHHLIYIDDLINGFINASTSSAAPGECLVLSGKEPLSTIEMMRVIAEVVGQDLPSFKVPLIPVEIAAVVLEKTLRPMGIQPPLHRRRIDFFKKSYRFSQEKMISLLNFQPRVSFKEGVIKTIRWYRQMNLMSDR